MLEPGPSAAELKVLGLEASDFSEDEMELWPENAQPVSVFRAIRTQWRVGPGGAYGLDYGVLPEIWRRLKVPIADRDEVFAGVQVMESAALELWHSKKAS